MISWYGGVYPTVVERKDCLQLSIVIDYNTWLGENSPALKVSDTVPAGGNGGKGRPLLRWKDQGKRPKG